MPRFCGVLEHAELVDEDLGALVGMRHLDAGDEPDGTLVVVRDQEVVGVAREEAHDVARVERIVEQRRCGLDSLAPNRACESPCLRSLYPWPEAC